MRSFGDHPAIGAALAVLLVVPACHRKPSPAPEASPKEAPSESAPARAAEFHEAAFDLSTRPAGGYTVGQASSVDIVLVPKGGYHTNDKYPYKLKLEPGSGIKFPSEVVTRDAVTLEPMRATMKVDLVPEASGNQQISGQFSFSVCSADRCLVEKRDITTTIRVN